jgi:hypothetical protein
VHEPESGVDLAPPAPPSESERRVAPIRASAEDERVASNRALSAGEQAPSSRRLDHSITLGTTSDFDARGYGAPAQPGDARGTTIVNVYVTPGAMPYYGASYGYGGVGFGPSFAATPFVRTTQAAVPTMRPGLDWPAVPNHGPSFPYRTGPASPWQGERPRR